MTASEDWQAALRRIMDEQDAADRTARRKTEASYRRAAHAPEANLGPQQAAAAWAYVEEAGFEATAVDGAKLGQDPRKLLGEE